MVSHKRGSDPRPRRLHWPYLSFSLGRGRGAGGTGTARLKVHFVFRQMTQLIKTVESVFGVGISACTCCLFIVLVFRGDSVHMCMFSVYACIQADFLSHLYNLWQFLYLPLSISLSLFFFFLQTQTHLSHQNIKTSKKRLNSKILCFLLKSLLEHGTATCTLDMSRTLLHILHLTVVSLHHLTSSCFTISSFSKPH